MPKTPAADILNNLLEELAAIEHERWAHWQRYLHDLAVRQPDGSLLLPAELVTKWERQIATPYDALSDEEQESDREQVQRYLPLLQRAFDGQD